MAAKEVQSLFPYKSAVFPCFGGFFRLYARLLIMHMRIFRL